MRALSLRLLTVLGLAAVLWGCKDEKEDLLVENPADYVALQPGKYITYRLDSTVFTQLGRNVEIHSYQEKHVVDAQFTDNEGRASFRIFRYLRDTAGTKPWVPSGTYVITPLQHSLEVVEDNMRVVKLVAPIKEGNSWMGNRYLAYEPYASKYSFVNDDFMLDWEFSYANTNDLFRYKGQDLPNVVSVVQADERYALDTVNISNNAATVPVNSGGVWLRGNATDTVRITAPAPSLGKEQLTIYNRTTAYATLNQIQIPPGLALYFEYSNGKWYYPNPLTAVNNKVALPANTTLAYIFGTGTADIRVDATKIDTNQVKKVTIYNKTNKDIYCDFTNTTLGTFSIPPGLGRSYEFYLGQWRLNDNRDVLLDKDPYLADLPFGTTSYSVEKYAKSVGLVSQELLMWEYQPNSGGTAYQVGFGVKRSMIDHN